MNVLRRVQSLKVKLSIVIVAAVAVAATTSQIGLMLGWPIWVRPVVATVISLLMVQVLARGMTRPLRDMESAVTRMAKGDYRHRVETDSVDEVGRLADAFNAMSAELAKIERERRDLVMNVSHELRTPLSALRAQLENMIDGVTQPTAEQLDVTLAQSLRLEGLISRLMDLARIESGQTPLHRTKTDLTDLIQTAVAEAHLRAPTAAFAVECPEDLKADLDEQLMLQVLANLLDNAARLCPDGRPIEIEARRVRSGIGRDAPAGLHIEVRDSGPGLAPDDADRIFERFYRADLDRSTSSGGAGLGLAISRGIVELHGGVMSAEANHPHGLRVIIEL